MRYCKRCVQPDTRPGIVFDAEGICPPCHFAEEAKKIDWNARKKELHDIADFGRRNNVSGYDCIIGVSGGKDSTRQAMYVRDELGLKPLLVSCTYPPEQLTERGAHNLGNLISLGFDCITASPDPVVWKVLMRQGFLKFGNWCKSTETALYSCTPRVAIAYHIPLIFLGENPAIALGALEVGSVSGDANRIKDSNTLKGGPESLLVSGIEEQDLFWYRYPSDEEMDRVGMRIVFLGYYIQDFNRFANAEFGLRHGLQVRDDPPEDIGDYYGFEALDNPFVMINQMFKYLKYGFGKVTDQVSEAVRLGLMPREDAVQIVKKYDGKCAPRFVKQFCEYLEITEEQFWKVAETFRNPKLWQKNADNTWTFNGTLS